MMLNIISPQNLTYFTEIDAMANQRECTACPEGTERCAHLGDDWVQIIYYEGEKTWGVFWSWPDGASNWGIFHGTEESANLTFDSLEQELRHPGDRKEKFSLAQTLYHRTKLDVAAQRPLPSR